MPRRNLSVLSSSEDPYTLDRFPRAFAVAIGKQTYNARQLAKAAKVKGQYLDMYRQPIPGNKVREILALTGQRPRANTGQLMPASGLAKIRKLAKRELLARQGKSVVGPMQYRATARPTASQPPRYRSETRSSPIRRIRSDRRAALAAIAQSTRSNGLARPYVTNAATGALARGVGALGLSYGDLRAMTDEQLMEEVLGTRPRRGSYPSSRR